MGVAMGAGRRADWVWEGGCFGHGSACQTLTPSWAPSTTYNNNTAGLAHAPVDSLDLDGFTLGQGKKCLLEEETSSLRKSRFGATVLPHGEKQWFGMQISSGLEVNLSTPVSTAPQLH